MRNNGCYSLGLNKENLRLRDHSDDELSHYSNATTDFEYKFPFGWGELWGVASRTDYDLKQHMQFSGEDFNYLDPETNEKYVPYCIEPSLGADRVTLAFLIDAYDEEQLEDGTSRTVMHFHPALAPFKAAVLLYLKSFLKKLEKYMKPYQSISLLIMMNQVQLVNDIADMMKLVHHSVSLLILILKKIIW